MRTRYLLAATLSLSAATTLPLHLSAQVTRLPDRATIRAELAPRFPVPAEPVAPVRPKPPGKLGAALTGLLVGGGAFVGTATLCGKAQLVGPSPYGGVVDGKQVAPGEVVNIAAPVACTAGFGAGLGLTSAFLMQRARTGGYARAVATYEQQMSGYVAAKASWDRALAQRERSLDSAVAMAYAEAEAATSLAESRERARRAQAELDAEIARLAVAERMEVPLVAPTTRLRNPNAVAVVIGNQRYSVGGVPPVDYAIRDAAMMRRFLVQTFGFREENIIFEQDASFATLTRIFGAKGDPQGRLYGFVQPDGSSDVFIFYSGHGAPDPGTGTGYLVSSDADPQAIRLTGYPMRQLQENLAQLPARSITMVLDACFSGLADRGALLRGVSPITLRVENPVLTHPKAVVLTASQSTEVSGWYDTQKHGLFTYVLLDAMAKAFGDGQAKAVPSANDLATRVRPEVQRLSRRLRQREQTPQLFGSAADAPLPFVRRPE